MENQGFKRGIDLKTALGLGVARSAEEWLRNSGFKFDRKDIVPVKDKDGNSVIEIPLDNDINATLKRANMDMQTGLNGKVKIVLTFYDTKS